MRDENTHLIARRRYHWCFRRAFLNKMSPTVKIVAIFSDFWRIFESKITWMARWWYHWRFHRAFSNKMSPYSQNYCDFQRFLLFRNKARNAGRSRKNAGMREISQNAGFPTWLRDGWHLWNIKGCLLPVAEVWGSLTGQPCKEACSLRGLECSLQPPTTDQDGRNN